MSNKEYNRMRPALGLILGLLVLLAAFPTSSSAQCTLPLYARSLLVQNPNGVALTDYVVKVTVNTSQLQTEGKLSNKFGLVFQGPDCVTPLPYFPSDADAYPSTNATYYVKIPFLPANDAVLITMNYDAVTNCPYTVADVFNSIGNSAVAPSPAGFSAATTWEISQLTFASNIKTYRWDVRATAAGTMRPKTTYTVGPNQYVFADGSLRTVNVGLNMFVEEINSNAGGHPGFYSGTGGLLMIGQGCGLCNNVKSSSGDVPPTTASLSNNLANDPRIEIWYRPRAAVEPTFTAGNEFQHSATITITPGDYVSICKRDSITFTASPGFEMYRWSVDGVQLSSSTSNTQLVTSTALVAGNHVVRVAGYLGACDSFVDVQNLFINPTPTIDSLSPNEICEEELFNASAAITTGGAVLTQYDWTFGDGNTGSGSSPSHAYFTSGLLDLQLAVTTDSGCVDTLLEPITVKSKPTITNIAETDICFPNPVAFSNTSSIPGNWNSATISQYDWRFGDANTGSGSSVSHAYALPNQYIDSLIVTTSDGCKDTLAGSVDVWPKPAIASISDPDICWPQPVSFSNVSGIPNNWNSATIDDYDWHFGDSTTGIGASTTHGYSIANQYNDSLIVITSDGCRDTLAETVDVFPKPVIGSISAPDICWPQAVTYEGFNSIPANWNSTTLTNHDWEFGDLNTATTNPATHAFATANQYTATYIITTGDACRDTLTEAVDIFPKPDIQAIMETDICWPDSVLFTNTTVLPNNWNADSVAIWDWRFGDGAAGTTSATAHYFAQPNQYIDTLFVTTNNSCMDTLVGSLDVWPKPRIDSIYTADVCEPNAVNFEAVTSIPFNWNMAGYSSYDWDFGDGNFGVGQITSHTYAATGLYLVLLTVTTTDGCTDTMSTQVNVFPKPLADFTVTDICYGDSLYLLNNSSIAGNTPMTWFWSFGDGSIDTVANPVHWYNVDGSYSVTLVATSGEGCKDTSIVAMDVFPKPNASFSFPRTCQPDSVPFLDASTVSSGVITNYDWTFGDGNSSTLQNPLHLYAAPDTFAVGLVVTTDNSCTDTLVLPLVWNPKPAAGFSFENVCFPETTVLTDTSSLLWGNITNWNWDLGDGNVDSTQNVNHNYVAGTYTVSLIVTTDSSCSDTVSQQLTTNEKPLAAFSPQTICHPDSAFFADLSTIGGAAAITAWDWKFGDGSGDSLQNPTHFYATPGTYDLEFVVWSDSGCSDTLNTIFEAYPFPGLELGGDTLWLCPFNELTLNAGDHFTSYAWDDASMDSTRTVDVPGTYWVSIVDTNGCPQTDTVIVPLAPQPDLQIVPGDSVAFCAGGTVVVDAATTGVLTYQWNGVTTSGDVVIDSAGDYTVIGWNRYACSDTVVVNVIENPLPLVDLGADRIICGPDSATLAAQHVYSSYFWSNGSADTTITVRNSGTFTLKVTDENGCQNTDTIRVDRYDLPQVNLGPDSSLCAGDEMTFNAGNFAQYEWSTSEISPEITVNSAGVVFVVVTDIHGCSNMSNLVNVTVDALPDIPVITKEEKLTPLVSSPEALYQWFFEGNILAGANLQEIIPFQSGNYTVLVTNPEGCIRLSDPFYIQLEIYEEEMYEGISPNGDGVNDFLTVPSVEYYPENEIVIYGQWGNKVYEKKGYLNHFRGLSQAGDPLPDGTYYYVLDLQNGQTPIKGFFVIHR